MKVWPEYVPIEILFRNGARLKFRGNRARFRYNERDQIVAIMNYATPRAEVERIQDAMQDSEVKTIDYWIYFFEKQGSKKQVIPPIHYWHPVPPKTFLNFAPGGDSRAVFLRRDNGRPFFANFTIDDVTGGKLPLAQRAFQFLEK